MWFFLLTRLPKIHLDAILKELIWAGSLNKALEYKEVKVQQKPKH